MSVCVSVRDRAKKDKKRKERKEKRKTKKVRDKKGVCEIDS